jgi:hypothetical protein
LCPRSKFDTRFQVLNDVRGYISYRGERSTMISYMPEDRLWVMTLVTDPTVKAVSTISLASMVMGKHLWTVYNDLVCSGEEASVLLSLTTCDKEQFTCDNGFCIEMGKRCNSRPDCSDLTDEFDCDNLQLGTSYQKYIAPPPTTGSDKVTIGVSADIVSVLDIDEISSIFQAFTSHGRTVGSSSTT